jgi:hypothetical protein
VDGTYNSRSCSKQKKRIQTHSSDGRAVRSLFREDRMLLKRLLFWVAKKKLAG